MNPSTQKRVSKACDACKRRKVKCNGQDRCQQCSHLGLRCIYSASGKLRTQGKRGHIISEFRKQSTGGCATSPPPLLPANLEQFAAPYGSPVQSTERNKAPCSASPRTPTALQYEKAFFLELIPDYLEGVYPVQPVITEHELRHYIHVMETDQEIRSFVYSFGGCTLNLTRYGERRTDEVVHTIENLTDLSIESLGQPRRHFRTSVMRAMQSIFIHNCLMSLQNTDAAFHYMRDAITSIQLLRIDNAEQSATLMAPERARRQRLYWQAYIHERFLAILDYRHAILPPLHTLPEEDPTLPTQVHEGFNQIIKLFRLLDTDFIASWLGTQNNPAPGHITSTWVEAKSRELEGDPETDARDLANLTMMQRADLTITREWLRTLVWRLAMTQTLLSSRSSKECLSLLFPIRLSQTLRHLLSSMSRQDIEVHGSSITQKLFEITDTIADVLIHIPAATLDETALRIDDFLFILNFVLLIPVLDTTRRGILLDKLERLQNMFPEAVSNTSSPNLPVQSPAVDDPWYQVAQSKTAGGPGAEGNEDGGAGAGAGAGAEGEEGVMDLGMGVSVDLGVGAGRESASLTVWNRISRRLSMANFMAGE